MEKYKLVGRNYETNLINNLINSNKSEFIAIYGRRRVGKTFLINSVLKERCDFYFTGLFKESLKTQLIIFNQELNNLTKAKNTTPKSWIDAFTILKEYLISLNKDTVIVFLDELPWMDVPKSHLLTAISFFWNMWNSNIKIKLFVCGSSTSWMKNKLIGDKGGLYGRTTSSIYIKEFTLNETKDFFKFNKGVNYSFEQILNIYMVTGGIPYYLDMFDTSIPISSNIDSLFFKEGGPLRNEFNFLFRSLFKQSINYKKVIVALSKKLSGISRDEILTNTNIEGGILTNILSDLRSCDFIRVYTKFGNKKKEQIYQLTDLYSLFYLRFIDSSDGQDENYYTKNMNTSKLNSWRGYAFEMICLKHINEIKDSLGISGILSNVCSWQTKAFIDESGIKWPGVQIDLLIDRYDKIINLCEIKYSSSPYIITKEYQKELIEKEEVFKALTKTRKAINTILISTNGIKQNEYSEILYRNLKLEDLFK